MPERAVGRPLVVALSGGVVRSLVMSGMIVHALTAHWSLSGTRSMWGIPVTIGLIEGFTRLMLGRHWPFDIALALPIGCAVLWCHHQAVRLADS